MEKKKSQYAYTESLSHDAEVLYKPQPAGGDKRCKESFVKKRSSVRGLSWRGVGRLNKKKSEEDGGGKEWGECVTGVGPGRKKPEVNITPASKEEGQLFTDRGGARVV